ncbi:MAG: AAA family ATPase [Proteobacteria bacterium]|nr:AAA family ATPase [Pseudomonadota bacterium]MBU1736646.1 AAA family ATPase [Pseudomonadota bacterium]
MVKNSLPSQKELEKEISDYLSEKYGSNVKIISTGMFPEPARQQEDSPPKVIADDDEIFKFRIRPEELVAYLDEYVIRQDEAKAVLATKICTHFNRIRYAMENGGLDRQSVGQVKSNVLLIGPTGVGKTFLIKLIARKLGVPFVKGDATKFSETGYVGGDVEDLVRDLARQADGDLEKARFGIIYVDEIDKIAASPNRIGHDVSRTGVQRALLKPMEDTDVDLKVPHDPISQLEAMEYYRTHGKREKLSVNTKNILFIMSGAFNTLDEIVRKRVGKQSIGFESTVTSRKDDARFLKQVKAEDLIEFGFESEFVGRLPVVTVLDQLSEEDLFQVLMNPNSAVVVGKKQDFRSYGIKVIFEEEALREIAAMAVGEKTGARGLLSVMEKIMLPFEKKLPSTDINFLVVSAQMVKDPKGSLAALLGDPDLKASHRERYQVLAAAEYDKLVAFLKASRADCFLRPEISVSEERFRIMARMCQNDNLDSNDACEMLLDLVSYIWECEGEYSHDGFSVSFSEEAIDRILARLPRNRKAVKAICDGVVKTCEYGLRLLSQKKDVHEVVIPAEGIDDPEKFINALVENKFKL